jgi:hypothetical protein
MTVPPVHRGVTAPLLALGLIVAEVPTALAQAPAPVARAEGPASPGDVQIATEPPRRPRRPLLDPGKRELRQARGLLAGGIVLTTLCGVGFGLVSYVIVDRWNRLYGVSGSNTLGAAGTLLGCTVLSIGGISVGATRLKKLRSSGGVAWTGGLGFRF